MCVICLPVAMSEKGSQVTLPSKLDFDAMPSAAAIVRRTQEHPKGSGHNSD